MSEIIEWLCGPPLKSAEAKNAENRKPFPAEDLPSLVERLNSGSLVTMKRPPYMCGYCAKQTVRTMRYIGDIDACAEWEYECAECGRKSYG